VIPASEALERLREGNRRFVSGETSQRSDLVPARRGEVVSGQQPFAIVVGCSDSRVPAEMVFDCGVGDLFVVRVAGNVVAAPQLESAEFAATSFGTRLVVVLGHQSCGAVRVTLDELQQGADPSVGAARSIVGLIRPAIEDLVAATSDVSADELMDQAVAANVAAAVSSLATGSEVMGRLIEEEGLVVVGARYCLETGAVEFFDGV